MRGVNVLTNEGSEDGNAVRVSIKTASGSKKTRRVGKGIPEDQGPKGVGVEGSPRRTYPCNKNGE